MPEMLWKNYIDFEIDEGEGANARALYERLLEKTGHVKVWISYSQFEGSEVGQGVNKARETFQRAHDQMKDAGMKEERVLLLDAWRVFEKTKGEAQSLAKVDSMLPRRVKRKRMATDENGVELGWEEYFDYHFPNDDNANAGNLKILEMAAKWKQAQQAQDDSSSSEEDDSDDEQGWAALFSKQMWNVYFILPTEPTSNSQGMFCVMITVIPCAECISGSREFPNFVWVE